MDPLVGTILGGDFKLTKMIGIGSYCKIYLAEQLSVGRRNVAVKVMHNIYIKETAKRKSPTSNPLYTEAMFLSMFKSPCFLKLFRTGTTQSGEPYIAMEYATGKSLDQIIKEGKIFSPAEAFFVLEKLGEGVGEMHLLNIVHRDLKPSNVIIESPGGGMFFVKIVDFGAAKSLLRGEQSSVKTKSEFVGSPAYMAPEQARQENTTERTDIYSLGSILYEMLTGIKAIHIKNTSFEDYLAYLNSNEQIPTYNIAAANPDVPYEVEEVVQKALKRNPDERFDSVSSFVSSFRQSVLSITSAGVSAPEEGKGILSKIKKIF